jgi:putative tricarboxylic transport membrane protein
MATKKTFLINDIFWMTLALFACLGGLKLGFGTFHQPQAGFMPFLAGLLLGLLALVDLISGLLTQWKREKGDKEIWSEIGWGKITITLAVLFIYTALFSPLGFIIGTILLLLFLFRLMEPRRWWIVLIASLVTTGLFYIGFKIGLDSQLPRGLLGF